MQVDPASHARITPWGQSLGEGLLRAEAEPGGEQRNQHARTGIWKERDSEAGQAGTFVAFGFSVDVYASG
ncbi:hypothetical protein GCM10027590_52650 [Nocardiopsis nanhaiensis]